MPATCAHKRWERYASGDKPAQAKQLLRTNARLFIVSKRHKVLLFNVAAK
ncbi:MAG TPA: hypothetical protein VMQ60_01495 [Acidobacteriaceae bacterium]|nr:hypothetical protein [Acidobacteriaceae bacterium]